MSDRWDFYFCRVNDVVSSVFVDLGMHDTAPDPARAHLLWVWVPLRIPREDGLSSGEEAPTLSALDDELTRVLGRALNAVFAGRITGGGRRELYFYAPTADGLDDAVRAVSDAYPDYELDYGDQPDAEWAQYLNVLYPGARDLQRMRNRGVVEVLEAEGDTLEAPRPVTHWIYFGNPSDRVAAAARLTAAGFALEEIDRGTDSPGLRLERVDRVDIASIDATVFDILDIIDDLDAKYDGWECPVEKPGTEARGLLSRLFKRPG